MYVSENVNLVSPLLFCLFSKFVLQLFTLLNCNSNQIRVISHLSPTLKEQTLY